MGSNVVSSKFSDYLFSKANQKNVPLSGALEISPICNMDCKMCYVRLSKYEVNKIGKEKTVDEWITLVEEAKNMGTLYLLLTGGEPFLYKDFKELYIRLYKMGLVLSINTNGTLVDEEVISWLSKYPPMRVNVTLYGSSNETYRKLCNNPNGFDQVKRGIELMKNANIAVKINASITPYNAQDLEEIHNFGQKRNIVVEATSYMFPPIRRDEKMIGKNDRFSPKEAAINQVKINKLRVGKEQFIKYAKKLENECYEADNVSEVCSVIEGESMKCRAGKSTFWISWDGRMMNCGMMNNPVTYPFEDGFEMAWKEMVEETKKIRLPKECSNCNYKEICKVCVANVITETGNTCTKPKYKCEFTKGLIEETHNEYIRIIQE